MFPIIDELLDRFNDHFDTESIVIDDDAFEEGVEELKTHLPEGTWLVAGDSNTWEAAGAEFTARLDAADVDWERYVVDEPDDGSKPICTEARIEAYEQALDDHGAVAGIAVGSGTINDIVKLASHHRGLPMACVGTAPSMNGYTSGIAAVLADGVKTTIPCKAPRVVIADVDVMAQAPYRMLCSGLGDLMSKPVSNADWQLSAWLNGTPHSDDAMEIIETGADMLDGVAPNLPERNPEAVAGLTASLMLSGLAMSVAGSSSPASGGEHLISHFIDMTAFTHGKPHDFHGCQVGVGTITSGFIYEKLRALEPDDIDIDARVDALVPWEEYEAQLQERFGPLFEAVVEHARPGYPTEDELRARLTKLCDEWDRLESEVARTLRTGMSLEEELRSAECPIRFSQLGVDADRAYRAVTHSKDIRNRYTILHLGWELGMLDEWARDILARLAADDGTTHTPET